MRQILTCVVLVACGACGSKELSSAFPQVEVPAGYEPQPDLGAWQFFRAARGEPVASNIEVRIDGNGRLRMRAGDQWRAGTLEAFEAHLMRSKEVYELSALLASGSTGSLREPGGPVSRLVVGIALPAGTPWLHLGWLMIVCEEQRLDKLQVAVGDRGINLFLPWDAAICGQDGTPPPHIRIDVRAFESEAGAVGYEIDGRPVAKLRGVVEVLNRALERATAAGKADVLVCVLNAQENLPCERVLDLIGAFLDAGIPRFEIEPCRVPSKAVRTAEVLGRQGR